MQTVAAPQPSFKPAPFTLLAVVLGLLGLCLAPSVMASTILASDGVNALTALPLGSNLNVGAAGLTAGREVEIQLIDWNGLIILRQSAVADANGEIASAPLWLRTGIGGCHCKYLGDGYPFRHPYEARQILGLKVTVQLLDTNDGILLAEQDLPIIERSRPLVFPANIEGCPQHLVAANESILLLSEGPTGAATVFVVAHRDRWSLGMPFQDLRSGFPQGQDIAASPQGWNELLWQGIESHQGHYDLLIRWHTQDPQPQAPLRLGTHDEILPLPTGGDNRTNGGLVIDDWGCGG
jgi:hypothetical protein